MVRRFASRALLLGLLSVMSISFAYSARSQEQTSGERGSNADKDQSQRPQAAAKTKRAYHNAPPTEPLPMTLDPAPFANNRSAFVAYSLARKIREVLYQVPCYCGCDRFSDHKSLLDCFTTKHGVGCHICQRGVIFAREQARTGKTAAEIREAMERGGLGGFDRDKYVDDHYDEYKQSGP